MKPSYTVKQTKEYEVLEKLVDYALYGPLLKEMGYRRQKNITGSVWKRTCQHQAQETITLFPSAKERDNHKYAIHRIISFNSCAKCGKKGYVPFLTRVQQFLDRECKDGDGRALELLENITADTNADKFRDDVWF